MKHFFRAKLFASVVLTTGGLLAQEAAPAQSPDVATLQAASTISESKPSESKTSPSPSTDLALTRSITAEGTQSGDSHVRIVRLSEVRGKVILDRNVGRGPEATLQNMPITQGMAMATGGDGYAEVEFEDGSALRLAPSSEARFPLLVLRTDGTKASTILADRGTVYFDTQKSKGMEFTLAMGKARISVAPGTHLRLEMTGTKAELAVISGMATVQTGDGAGAVVAKKQTMTLDTAGTGQTEVAKGIFESPYDGWDSDASKYHARYMRTSQNMGSTALYGMSDLNYYGGFVNGCGGSFWQPYMVSAGWSPYSQGMWTLYSTGYSWVSPYPWGWLPFHSGAWSYCSGVGWGWNPGGSWYGLRNVALMNPVGGGGAVSGSYGIARAPNAVALPRPPHGSQSMVVQSNGEMVRSTMDRPDNFVFRRDSAGMGVPRGSLGGLHGISRDVERHGFANREVYADTTAPARSMMVRGGDHGTAASSQANLPTTLRRGPAPEGLAQGNERFAWKNGGPNATGAQQQNSARPGGNAQGSVGPRPSGASNGASQGSFNRGGGQAGGGGSFNRGGGGMPAGGGNAGGGGRGSAPAGTAPH
jgi:hypothetical protein